MSIRTTSTAVGKIIELDPEISLTPYIEAASGLIDEICVYEPPYTSERLEQIERWLSAHFYTVRDPRASSEGVSGVSQSLQGSTAMYFESSIFGQHALLLDYRGGLARLMEEIKSGSVRTPTLTWLGKDDTPRNRIW